MRAFVTGGTGFVGANLVAGLIDRGVQVRVLHRESSSLAALQGLAYEGVIGDVLDDEHRLAESMTDCDWVFHTAAISDYWRYRGREQLYRTNVIGTRTMAAAALRAGVTRFVYTSSIAALGSRHRDTSWSRPMRSTWPHDSSPWAQQVPCGGGVGSRGRRRAPGGDGQPVGGDRSARCEPDRRGDGGAGRPRAAAGGRTGGTNFVATTDVVAGHLGAAERGRIGERYILAGQNLTFHDAFTTVCQMVGSPPPAVTLPRWIIPVAAGAVAAVRTVIGPRLPIDAKQMRLSGYGIYADGTKARTELGAPCTPFATAITEAYRWYAAEGLVPAPR